jgi:hypothetical protein
MILPATGIRALFVFLSITGQENIDFDRFAITSQAEEEMTDRKIDKKTNSALIPVAGRIIKTFSKDHQGLFEFFHFKIKVIFASSCDNLSFLYFIATLHL